MQVVGNRFNHDADDDEVDGMDIERFSTDAQGSLNYLSNECLSRVSIGRRTPKSTFNVKPCSKDVSEYFEALEESGLWIRIPTPNPARKFTWYSPYYQAGSILGRFHQLIPATLDGDGTRRPRLAAGSVVCNARGDLASLAPPFVVHLNWKTVGTLGQLGHWHLTMDATIVVVPSLLRSTVQRHAMAPNYDDGKRFIVLPIFACQKDHCQRQIQKTCRRYGFNRTCLGVISALEWQFEDDPLPNPQYGLRAADSVAHAGHVWSEQSLRFVKFRNRQNKDSILNNNWNIGRDRYVGALAVRREAEAERLREEARQKRSRDSRRANKRKRLQVEHLPDDDDAQSDNSTESLTPSELEWYNNQRRH